MIRAGETEHRVNLSRKDMIVFEQRLLDAIASFFPFTGHSMHFPRGEDDNGAVWLAEENKLMLPLTGEDGSMLGLFVARGGKQKAAMALIPHWPALRALIADNLLLYKRGLCDPVTGLFTRHHLLRCMDREIETLREPLGASPDPSGQGDNPAANAPGPSREAARNSGERLVSDPDEVRRSSMATLVVRLAALRDVAREFGYQFADELTVALADALMTVCPEQALAARTGDSEFTVHLPSAGPRACRTLASEIVQALRKVFVVHPLKREQVGICVSVGYTLYPQDAAGSMFIRPSAEQSRLMLKKARLTAALAEETPFAEERRRAWLGADMEEPEGKAPWHGNISDADSVMGFGSILAEGGRVLENLPLSRVLVSLGSNMHAREGRRFSVWSARHARAEAERASPPLYKGEIVLMDVHEDVSQAEVIHLGEPGWSIEPGDHLVLLPEERGSPAKAADGEMKLDPATGLLRHGDFLARWTEERESIGSFALALLRLAPKQEAKKGGDANPDRFMAEAARLRLENLAPMPGEGDTGKPGAPPLLGGRYGLNSLIFFHPSPDTAFLSGYYARLNEAIESRLGLEAAVGIAMHPCLDFRKADALENCQKALEYAMLLPKPHVGVLDSLALNISADKRFSQGDSFEAIKEYQRALLADESNGMAWNSLGICLAGLNRHSEAERHFTRALDCDPDDVMALYNLGYMHQSQGRPDEAGKCYERCLELEAGHLHALVRLGQLAESGGDPKTARKLYEQAAALPGGKGLTCLARLCISEGNNDEAREHLHEALLHDPQDALAMALLSGMYLDAGEDPELAASFARQSVSLRPALRSGWLQLGRAMEALGRIKEAREARLKAGEM